MKQELKNLKSIDDFLNESEETINEGLDSIPFGDGLAGGISDVWVDFEPDVFGDKNKGVEVKIGVYSGGKYENLYFKNCPNIEDLSAKSYSDKSLNKEVYKLKESIRENIKKSIQPIMDKFAKAVQIVVEKEMDKAEKIAEKLLK